MKGEPKMKSIFKFPLQLRANQTVEMQPDAEILSVQKQNETITIWAVVDPEVEMIQRRFRIAATGEEFTDEGLEYIGTVQLSGLVWHIFEVLD
jgi:hypothetical protein